MVGLYVGCFWSGDAIAQQIEIDVNDTSLDLQHVINQYESACASRVG